MCEFKNGDVLLNDCENNVIVKSPECVFIGNDPCDADYIYVRDIFGVARVKREYLKLKPRKEKRWIAVFDDGHVYHTHHVNKAIVKSWVAEDHDAEYADKAQYVQIEIEV